MSTYSQAYSALNHDQKLAVDHLDGPVMVIAGPGTGKTQVMAVRIGSILQHTDTSPRSILALTFTDSATKNLRQRLVDLLGVTGYQVPIHTFHSFCSMVIQEFPEYFSFNRDSKALTELEKYQIISDILASHPFEALKPMNAGDLYLRELSTAISNLKREAVSPSDLEKLLEAENTLLHESESTLGKTELARRTKRLKKQHELVLVYQEYQASLVERSQFDFEDMIATVRQAFSTEPDLLAEYQERFLYLLVDEYQDTNAAQNAVVDLLASHWGEDANLFVVGDPHQSIYRFQGASVENMLGFTLRYPSATTITLSIGYRCPQPLYDAAAALIAHNTKPQLRGHDEATDHRLDDLWAAATRPLVAAQKSTVSPKQVTLPAQTQDYIFLTTRIRELLDTGVSADQIAILYRHNADCMGLITLLEQADIPYDIDGGIDILKMPVMQQWQALLECIELWQHGVADNRLYEVLQQPWWQLSPVILMKLARAAHGSRKDWWTVLTADEAQLQKWEPQFSSTELQTLLAVIANLQRWASALLTTPVAAWLRTVLSESGLLKWLTSQPNRLELLAAMNTWLSQVESWREHHSKFTLTEALSSLTMMRERNISLSLEDLNLGAASVTLSTVHKAKGREWQYVFLLNVVDGKWGNNFSRELLPLPEGILTVSEADHAAIEDERRLFYVALTRAKQEVVICTPQTILSDTRSKEAVVSQFVTEIATHLQEDSSSAVEAARARDPGQLLALLQPVPERKYADRERAYVQSIAQNLPLSVSALNAYLESPTKFVDQYLLRIPTLLEPQLAFGSAIHKALEVWTKQWMSDGAQPNLEFLLHTFVTTLQAEPLDETELARRLKYGQQVLTKYFTALSAETQPPLYVERFFGKGSQLAMLGDIQLTGRIDRIEWLDEAAKTVRVIDYKTGRAKTPGQVFATDKATLAELSPRERQLPESIRARYQRQMVFYKLLTDLDPTFKVQVTEGTFVFVEPDPDSGKLTTRSMPLTDQAVNDLKTLIQEVAGEIRELKFLDAE